MCIRDSVKADLEIRCKRLQIVENCMRLQRAWQGRMGPMEKAYSEFDSGFLVLQSFAASDPSQGIKCAYMWHLRLQLQVCHGVSTQRTCGLLTPCADCQGYC